MSLKEVSSLDGKGRVLIPSGMRDALNLKEGEKILLELDPEGRAIMIEPAYEKKLLILKIALSDKPGALAAAAAVLARLKVDLVSTNSHSTRRGEEAVWEVKCNPSGTSVSKLKEALSKAGARVLSAQWK